MRTGKANCTDDQIREAYPRLKTIKAVMRELKVGMPRARRVLGLEHASANSPPLQPHNAALPKRISADDFISDFDLAGRVRQALCALGRDAIRDADFRADLGIPNQQWAAIRDLPEFAGNQIERKGVRFWAGLATITEARKRRDLL